MEQGKKEAKPAQADKFQLFELQPIRELQPYVRSFFHLFLPASGSASPARRCTVLANPFVDIILNFRAPFRIEVSGKQMRIEEPYTILGPSSGSVWLLPEGDLSLNGIRFQDGVVGSFLPFPARDLMDSFEPLAKIWPSFKADLIDSSMRLKTNKEQIENTNRALLAFLKGFPPPDPLVQKAVRLISEHKGNLEINRLSELLDVSRQTIKTRFDQHVGVTPKQFGKLLRFQNTLKVISASGPGQIAWSRLATDCGYYDQAHFIREFNSFTGFPPERFLKNLRQGEEIYFFETAETTVQHLDGRRRSLEINFPVI